MDRPNGDGAGVSTSTSRICRAARSRIRPTRPGTSNTSCRHSRTVSSTIGNVPYLRATDSSWAERCRCCHSGLRRPGWRRGSSSARAAHSRNLDANRADRAELVGDQSLHLVRGQLGDARGRRLVRVRDPDHDPVVGVQGLYIHARVALAQPGRDGQRPRSVHRRAEGTVQHQPPVTQLVSEPFHHQRAVIRQVPGGLPLRRQVAHQVGRGQFVEAIRAQPGDRFPLAGASPSSRQ